MELRGELVCARFPRQNQWIEYRGKAVRGLFVMAIRGGRILKLIGAMGLQKLAVMMLLTLAQPAWGQSIVTGADLQEVCKSAETFPDCVFFLKTVDQTAKAMGQLSDPTGESFVGSCAPEKGIDTVPLVIALRLAWLEYAEKYQQRMQKPAAEQALLAFEARWPCAR